MDNSTRLDAISIETMHSGRLCLNLTSCVGWDGFPAYAEIVIGLLNGNIVKKSDSMDVRAWEILIDNEKFFLAHDDFSTMISLESTSLQGDQLITQFKNKFNQYWRKKIEFTD
ncbi:DUF3630 family protein [Pseudomonas fluorescens]|uniref:DUF3630 family protein n=1 Tax=Pseudomonas fluorescens TaxID=294 RepID=UPI001780FCA8|nr:DUF3630 family protein [Pseudomonas fluorescens]